MKKKRQYYRTAALLGPQTHNVAYRRARPKSVRIPWRLLVPLLGVVGLVLWCLLGDAWFLLPENVVVKGGTSTALKREVLLTSDLLWWHRFSLKPREAEARLLAEMPGLKDATVTCALFPTACEIVVTEREPALVWIDGADIYWIDDDGVVFTAQGQRPQLPVVRGPLPDVEAPEVSEDVIAAEIAAEAAEMTDEAAAEAVAAAVAEAEAEAAAAAEAEMARTFGAVQEGIAALAELGLPTDSLEYNPQRGLIWVDGEGRRVAFGVGPDMAARWQMYEALIAHLDSEGIFPWTVDVRFPGGITYSLERSW